MSAQSTLSRRKALSLLGAAASSLVPTRLAAQAAEVRPADIVGAGTSIRSQYVFGYGSLIDRRSRMGTWPNAEFALPVVVKGIARGWFDQTDVPSWSPTYLGAVADAEAECNGIVFAVTPAELETFTRRESGYQLTKINASQLTMLVSGAALPDGDIWYFACARKRFPTDERPIVQSYVDVCLGGCLEIEAMYPLARQASFAERFIKTTSNWGPPWINDRIYPWRPFVHVPRAFEIDALIQKVLGREVFAQIRLK